MGLFVVGWIVLGIALLTLYGRFISIYQATHDVWRPQNVPWRPYNSLRVSLDQLRATIRRDANVTVENARRLFLAILALAVAYLVVGFPLAGWVFR